MRRSLAIVGGRRRASAAREAADGESYADDQSEGLAAFATAAHGADADAAEALARLRVPEPVARLLPEGRFTARVRDDGRAMTIDVDGATPRSGAPGFDAVPASAWLAAASGDLGAELHAIPELLDCASRRLGVDAERRSAARRRCSSTSRPSAGAGTSPRTHEGAAHRPRRTDPARDQPRSALS